MVSRIGHVSVAGPINGDSPGVAELGRAAKPVGKTACAGLAGKGLHPELVNGQHCRSGPIETPLGIGEQTKPKGMAEFVSHDTEIKFAVDPDLRRDKHTPTAESDLRIGKVAQP